MNEPNSNTIETRVSSSVSARSIGKILALHNSVESLSFIVDTHALHRLISLSIVSIFYSLVSDRPIQSTQDMNSIRCRCDFVTNFRVQMFKCDDRVESQAPRTVTLTQRPAKKKVFEKKKTTKLKKKKHFDRTSKCACTMLVDVFGLTVYCVGAWPIVVTKS